MSLQQAASQKVLLAAHRGIAGANIPCNSIPAFQGALNQGADLIELDISRSLDGVLYVFHPGMEPVFLHSDKLISELTSTEVDRMYLVNQDHTATLWTPPRLEEVFQLLKGRCYINLDKFWTCPAEIAALVRQMGMQDQVLIKTSEDPTSIARVEEVASDLPYMVIMKEEDQLTDELLKRNVRYVGVEALFKTEDAPICQPDYIQSMRKRGLVAWANSIVYDYRAVLSAGHTDDVSIAENGELGWGWLARRGFNIIQTDWIMAADQYLRSMGYR